MNNTLRLTMFVADADKDEANKIAAEITGNPADLNTYSTGLSPDGSEPATHWCCSTVSSEEMGQYMVANIPRVPSIRWFTQPNTTDPEFLLFSNVPAAAAESLMQSGAYTLYDFAMMLAKVGLRRVVSQEEMLL